MSSETQYNYMEQKIREAASQAGLPYSDSAWKNMEKLLDKGKDRRRPFLWLVPALLVGLSVAGFIMYKTTNKEIEGADASKEVNVSKSTVTSINLQQKASDALIDTIIKTPQNNAVNTNTFVSSQPQLATVTSTNNTKDIAYDYRNTRKYASRQKQNISITAAVADDDESIAASSNKKPRASAKRKIVVDKSDATKEDNEEFAKADNTINQTTETKSAIADSSKQIDIQKALLEKAPNLAIIQAKKEKESSTNTTVNSKKEKKSTNILPKFYVLGSYGGEITSTKFFSFANAAITGRTAFNLGYQINDRFAVQAGFASSSKKRLQI
jgi:hypothetical protein